MTMLKTLTRTLSAATLSIALAMAAMTGSATPARADGSDAARILVGLIAIYGISRAIEMNNERRTTVSRNQHVAPARPVITHPNRDQWNARVAPENCRVEFNTTVGLFRGYRARCMQQSVARPGILPPQCIEQFTTDRGNRSYYGGRCLAQNGWVREAGARH